MKFPLSICMYLLILTVSSLGQNSAQKTNSPDKIDHDINAELSPYQRITMYLGHSLFKAEAVKRQSEILWGIKGINPVIEVAENVEEHFDKTRVEQKYLDVLREKSIPIDKEEGHLLLFRIRGVWDKDKVTLAYTYDLDLVDKVYVSRDGQIKSNFRSVWNISNLGFAGIAVYENAMLINVESAVDHFAISYYEQLDFDIISDTPRYARTTYRKIRDGDEDIIKLLGDQKLDEELW